jgi:hypothetical protein
VEKTKKMMMVMMMMMGELNRPSSVSSMAMVAWQAKNGGDLLREAAERGRGRRKSRHGEVEKTMMAMKEQRDRKP